MFPFILALLSWTFGYAALIAPQHLEELEARGFTVLENVWQCDDLERFRQGLERVKQSAFALMHHTASHPRIFYENEVRHESKYWKLGKELVMQAGEGRLDFFLGFGREFFPENRIDNPLLDALMEQLLGGEYTHNAGVILAAPGGKDQYWHRDTHTLSNWDTTGAHLVALDDFYFTVLIPITVPLTLENGTTEFMTGSHRLPSSEFAFCAKDRICVPLGCALVFNGKINHRGRANESAEERPVLYITYYKKWYNETYRVGIES